MELVEIIAKTKRQLGEPQIKIELSAEDYQDSLFNSRTFYSRIKPKKVYGATTNTNGGAYVQLTDAERKDLIDVVDCDYKNIIKQTFNYGGIIETPIIPYEWQLRSDRYVAVFNKIQMDAKTLGYDGDWKFVDYEGRIYLSPQVLDGVEVAYILTKIREVQEIPTIDLDLFVKLMEAFCRDKLADVRGKYSGVPSPAGTLTLDAAEQRAKAEKLREDVKATLYDQMGPAGYSYG